MHPNGLLAVFQYTCQTYVGVLPSVALFRQYFYARLKNEDMIAGGVTFCIRENTPHRFITLYRKIRWTSDATSGATSFLMSLATPSRSPLLPR
jgi:hypothetical protein